MYVYVFLYFRQLIKSALLTINSPWRSDYFQTVQQSQEKQSCYQHVGHGAQHRNLSGENITHQSPLVPVRLEVVDRQRRVTVPRRWCSSLEIRFLCAQWSWQRCRCRCLPTRICFCTLSRQKAEASPSPGWLLRGSLDAWTAVPQRLAGWTEHQASLTCRWARADASKSCSCPSFVLPAPVKKLQEEMQKWIKCSSPPRHLCCCWPQIEAEAWSPVSQRSEWRRSSSGPAGPPLSLPHPTPPHHILPRVVQHCSGFFFSVPVLVI